MTLGNLSFAELCITLLHLNLKHVYTTKTVMIFVIMVNLETSDTTDVTFVV